MADHFADRFWSARFWNGRYYQSGTQASGTMRANLSGSGGLAATITGVSGEVPRVNFDRIGGAGWQKKKPKKKDELVEEVVAEVVQAVPQPIQDETRIIALRMAEQMTVRQLQEIRTIEALIARVEAEIAEMDDEEVLLLAA